MKIANIVYANTIDAPEEFNVVNSFDDIIEGLPTLIIGFDYVNTNYPNFDITEIALAPNLYWTFKRNEKRDKHDDDLRWFISKVYEDLVSDIIYIFVDPIQYKKKTLIKIIKKLYSLDNAITYQNEDVVYIYSEKFLFGIDLKLLRYMGLDTEKIILKIKKLSYVFLSGNDILIEYNKNIEILGNRLRYIPYLYSLRHGQNNTSSIVHLPKQA